MRILYIDIDTLRPDHMGCYGYKRNTTPNIDQMAEGGMVFDRYYCPDAPCLPSRAAFISGRFGLCTGVVGHGGTAADRRLTGANRDFKDQADTGNLIHTFRKAGLYTASISTFAERHSAYWWNAGFNECYNVGGCGGESGEQVLPVCLDWLTNNRERDDWFLHVHFWDPHTPYRAPSSFGNPFEDVPLDHWITEDVLKHHRQHIGPHSANEVNMYDDHSYPRQPGKLENLADVKRLFDGYDCGIRYADYLIGQIFDLLKAQGLYEETAVILSSDHGENMGELGLYSEHATADHITCRIPMIVKWPGGVIGRDNNLHYNLDFAPTIAELLSVKASGEWDGLSYAAAIKPENAASSEARDHLVLSQMAHVCQRSVVFEDWLYIRTYHDGYHLFDDEMLFNLKDDPHEQHDLKEAYPSVCSRGAKYILDWHDFHMKKANLTTDPLWVVMNEGGPYHTWNALPRYLKRLEQTGRKEGADRLRKKYGL